MFKQSRPKTILLLCMLGLLVLALAGCSSSAYLDGLIPTIGDFNSALDSLNVQFTAYAAENTLFQDTVWQSDTSAALSDLKGASEALIELPDPEEDYVTLNDLVQEMASQTILAIDAYKAAINANDIYQMNNGGPYIDRVIELLIQINTEIDRLNQ